MKKEERNSQIWCRKVKEQGENIHFWICDEETGQEWEFYTSVNPDEMDIYNKTDDTRFVILTPLDKAKLERMSEQYSLFLQDKVRQEEKEKAKARKLKRKR